MKLYYLQELPKYYKVAVIYNTDKKLIIHIRQNTTDIDQGYSTTAQSYWVCLSANYADMIKEARQRPNTWIVRVK